MKLSSEPSGAFEAALDQFEEQWLRNDSPPNVIAAVTELRQLTGFAERRVAWELAMSDLEFRWRHTDPIRRRGSRWYAEKLGPLGLTEADVEELCLHELIVRSRWADRPPIESLLESQYPGMAEESRCRHRSRMVRQLEAHFPLECVVNVEGGNRFRAQVPTPCVFGRQRWNDPEPGGPHPDAANEGWRIIVVEREQSRVSRNQILIRRLAVHQVSVELLSENVGCHLQEQRLSVGQPVVVQTGTRPPELRFQGVTVRLFSG